MWSIFLKDFYVHITAVESISLYRVFDCNLKTKKKKKKKKKIKINNTMVISPDTQYNFSSMKFYIWSML